MRVEDAHGAPPTIPFWRGEAPSRTEELSAEVASLREQVSQLLDQTPRGQGEAPSGTAELSAEVALSQEQVNGPKEQTPSGRACGCWLETNCGLDASGAEQVMAYIDAGRQVLGGVPTQTRIIAERFFDEAGGMQLVIHAPFGGRLNRAWGLALRKRFCVNFDFELQAAATDEGLVLSLGEKHSFPLDAIFQFLQSHSVREVLTQALLATPMFVTRWRWNISRSLALLRFQKGKKVPLHLQRMRAEDLLGAAFPQATACQDNHVGDREIPDHPLVQETVRDCLTEAMDVEGLSDLLRKMEQGDVQCLAVESPAPSPFSHEILNANPYAFLDDAPLEERRARAVNLRQVLPSDIGGQLGALNPDAIAAVIEEAWPTVRDADELHEALHLFVWVPEEQGSAWSEFLPELVASGRAAIVEFLEGEGNEGTIVKGWVTTEHLPMLRTIFHEIRVIFDASLIPPSVADEESNLEPEAARSLVVRGWMESCGPVTVPELSSTLHISEQFVRTALLGLESEGQVLRGQFRGAFDAEPSSFNEEGKSEGKEEWCDRRLLARIHRRTVASLRREIEPVSAADFMRFLFRWQHRAPGTQLHGEAGLQEIITQLAGFEAPASAWETSLLKERLSNYKPELLDTLCLRGVAAWGRLTPPVRDNALVPAGKDESKGEFTLKREKVTKSPRRITPTSLAPVSFFLREEAPWLMALAQHQKKDGPATLRQVLSSVAQEVLEELEARGASFFADLKGATGHVAAEIESALWELVAAGLVTADGFDNLRSLLDPKRRRAQGKERSRRPRHSAGRWALLLPPREKPQEGQHPEGHLPEQSEQWARQLLRRYGVVFRDLVKRESMPIAWRELLVQFRRLEWRGEIRGGRFVDGFTGEQFALPEAVESLRAVRRDPQVGAQEIRLSPADPLNLVGIILPGERIPTHSSKTIFFRNGVPYSLNAPVVALA